ncbi:response regulator transcription factor [Neolewinella lacunae]|uniref:Response regulator transcription factor n=1 Tax=Neolewinella lacunae TaxID=1517758 RepID=A0A923PTX3_9BACT|nr:response regulator transcription factor [Neolewinella lacunae]MBC6996742.1 response regulator transcription factor [Neolewinella lacunae]MDN3633393.1 response regulator transcription factor [Neolewinella lacunae]
MTPLRCLLIDDERLARVELRALLEEHPGVEVLADTGTPAAVPDLVTQWRPDLIFLDINMPACNGFELLSHLPSCPPVVFVTAYEEFALQAFSVHALDYLLKPVQPARLAETLRVVRERLHAERGQDRKIFIATAKGGHYLALNEVFLIRAYDHYLRLYSPGGTDLIHHGLASFLATCPEHEFFRANRSEAIRIAAVVGTGRLSRGRLLLELPQGHRVRVSESQSILWRKRKYPGGEE